MPVVQDKWVTSPLVVIKEIFGSGSSAGEVDNWGVQRFFQEKLETEEGRAAVPLLTSLSSHHLPDGCLVRYRGMVQDQLGTEFYLKKYRTISQDGDLVCCGLYSDPTHLPPGVEEVSGEDSSNIMADRATLYCVPIPAQTQWVREMWEGHEVSINLSNMTEMVSSGHKRKLEESESEENETMDTTEEDSDGSHGNGECSHGNLENKLRQNSEGTGKKHCPSDSQLHGNSVSMTTHDLNFPITGESGVPCLVKVYSEWEEFHVCNMVEVVGVLSVHPDLAPPTYTEHEQQENSAERRAHSPPPYLVPRLHAITCTRLSHCNPLLPHPLTTPLLSFLPEEHDVSTARTVAMDTITQVLGGDRLAAEYLLLHLLSSVYARAGTMALGKFSLNLTGCHDSQLRDNLFQLLSSCLTKCLLLPLSLEKLNSLRFTPKKDYDSDRLMSGTLQLSAGTHILADETALSTGQLSEVGVANITALGNVIQWQRLSYNFEYHTTEFDTDLPVLLVSEGRSMIKVDCQVPVQVTGTSTGPVLSQEQLDLLRRYFTLCQKFTYSLGPPMQQVIEDEFVRQRQSGNDGKENMSEDRLHQLLCVARLVAISHGSSSLTPQLWTHTHALEDNRIQRLPTNE